MFYETLEDCGDALRGIRFEPSPVGGTSLGPRVEAPSRSWFARLLGRSRSQGVDELPAPVQADRFTDEVIEAILSTASTGARLVTTGASGTRSRIGGLPDLPRGAPWPTDPPVSFLGQFDFAELNGQGQIGELPTSGLLSLFFDVVGMPGDWELNDGKNVKVHWDPKPLDLVEAEPPPTLAGAQQAVFDPTPIKAVHGVFIPDGEDLSCQELGLVAPFDLEYSEWQSDVEHHGLSVDHRLGGRVSTIQNGMQEEKSKSGERTMPLLQLDSDPGCSMTFGDLGRLYLWIWPDDLRATRLDRAKLRWQS